MESILGRLELVDDMVVVAELERDRLMEEERGLGAQLTQQRLALFALGGASTGTVFATVEAHKSRGVQLSRLESRLKQGVILKDRLLVSLGASRHDINVSRKGALDRALQSTSKQRALVGERGGASALGDRVRMLEGKVRAARSALREGREGWEVERGATEARLWELQERVRVGESAMEESLVGGCSSGGGGGDIQRKEREEEGEDGGGGGGGGGGGKGGVSDGPGSGDLTKAEEAIARLEILSLDESIVAGEGECHALYTTTVELREVLGAMCHRGGFATVEAMVAWVVGEETFSQYTVGTCALLQSAVAGEGEVLRRVQERSLVLGRGVEASRVAKEGEKAGRQGEGRRLGECLRELREGRGGAARNALGALTAAFMALYDALGGGMEGEVGGAAFLAPPSPSGVAAVSPHTLLLTRGPLEALLSACETQARGLLCQGVQLLSSHRVRCAAVDAVLACEARAKSVEAGQAGKAIRVALEDMNASPDLALRLIEAVHHAPPPPTLSHSLRGGVTAGSGGGTLYPPPCLSPCSDSGREGGVGKVQEEEEEEEEKCVAPDSWRVVGRRVSGGGRAAVPPSPTPEDDTALNAFTGRTTMSEFHASALSSLLGTSASAALTPPSPPTLTPTSPAITKQVAWGSSSLLRGAIGKPLRTHTTTTTATATATAAFAAPAAVIFPRPSYTTSTTTTTTTTSTLVTSSLRGVGGGSSLRLIRPRNSLDAHILGSIIDKETQSSNTLSFLGKSLLQQHSTF